MTAPTTVKAEWSPFDVMAATVRRDEYGNPADCCWDAHLAGRTAGYVEGHAAGRESVWTDIEADVRAAARGAAKSIDVRAARARPYSRPGWAR